jgi:hypothetical protein
MISIEISNKFVSGWINFETMQKNVFYLKTTTHFCIVYKQALLMHDINFKILNIK